MLEIFCKEHGMESFFNKIMSENPFEIEVGNTEYGCKKIFAFYNDLALKRWKNNVLNPSSSIRKYKEVMNNNKDKYCYSVLFVVWFSEFVNYCQNEGLWNQLPPNCDRKAIKINFIRKVTIFILFCYFSFTFVLHLF